MITIDIQKPLHGIHAPMMLDVHLNIEKNEFVALSGVSGSGKTTLLRIIAGLESVTQGKIEVDNRVWMDTKANKIMPIQKREIGYLFQDYALFPNMTVMQNLLFAQKDTPFAEELLEIVGLKELHNRIPNTLSGGQKQRIALCRALMKRPKVLLLDEPLSALDVSMRKKLQEDIKRFHRLFNMTVIMVSHDPSEIYKLSSRVIVLEQGKILKEGDAKEVLLKTSGSQKFSFIGELLEIYRADILNIAVVSIGEQIVKVVLDSQQANELCVGDHVSISTKAFSPTLSKL